MKKVITIGGATQDVFLHFIRTDSMRFIRNLAESEFHIFASGEKVEIEKLEYLTGGGSTNSATAFKRMGFDVQCFSQIGDDSAGKFISNELEKEDINISLISITKEHPTAKSFIIHAADLDRTILVHQGANGFMHKDKIPYTSIEKADLVYITSLNGKSASLLEPIAAHAKKHSITVAVNPGSSQLCKETNSVKNALANIDILLMNASEAKMFMMALINTDETFKKLLKSRNKKTLCPPDSKINQPCLLNYPVPYENFLFSTWRFFKETIKMGPKIIVLTNGANGVYVGTPDIIYFHPSLKTNVVDTVGAGDSFGSCFAAQIIKGKSVEDALRYGMVNSASVISKIGAKPGLLTQDELNVKVKGRAKDLLQKFEVK